ncbi:hypothetical protein [Roseivirga sp.]|uniref:hypothetical protein n=1 Tax=Roseivirga sp. TaxID=1964215 RepID=UPI002B273AA8|nr:hypothetical protein [Roseivirga sp.]
MRTRILILLAIVFQSHCLLGQSLTVEYIDQYIQMSQPSIEFGNKEKLYVIDGVPNSNIEIESKLVKYKLNDKFLFIDYLFSDSLSTTVFKPNLLIVLIHRAQPLKLKNKKKELRKAIEMLSSTSEPPAFMLNDRQLSAQEARQSISVLRPRNIDHISFNKHAPLSIYGADAKNGLIRIWTKN